MCRSISSPRGAIRIHEYIREDDFGEGWPLLVPFSDLSRRRVRRLRLWKNTAWILTPENVISIIGVRISKLRLLNFSYENWHKIPKWSSFFLIRDLFFSFEIHFSSEIPGRTRKRKEKIPNILPSVSPCGSEQSSLVQICPNSTFKPVSGNI